MSDFPDDPLQNPLVREKYALVRQFLRAWREQDTLTLRLLLSRATRDERRLPDRPPSSAMQSVLQRAEVGSDGVILFDLLLSDPDSAPSTQRLVVRVVTESGSDRIDVLPAPKGNRPADDLVQERGERRPEAARPPVPADPLAEAARVLAAVQEEMERVGVWDVPRPTDAAIASGGAFGGATMAFVQWLRWVWAERMQAMIASGGPFPPSSQLASYAVREFDGQYELDPLIERLREVDDFVRSLRGG